MPRRKRPALVLAVTGGIGAGKSTFCRLLRARPGVAHIDADRIVRGLLAHSPRIRAEVVARFGRGVLARDGTLDRGKLAARVFGDRRALRRLEAILHPVVLERLQRKVDRLKRGDGIAIVVVEIPLLVEVGVPAWVDRVVTVEADRATRLARLERRGIGADQARRRMRRQADDRRRRRAADWVVRNDGSIANLERGAHRLWERLLLTIRTDEAKES